jgi:hypothetical protein
MWLEQQEFQNVADPPEGLCIITKFPAVGATSALIGRGALPLRIYSAGGKPSRIEIILGLRDQDPNDLAPEVFRQTVTSVQTQLRAMERSANEEISAHRKKMLQQVLEVIRHRERRLRAVRRAADELGIPLAPRSDAGHIELKPRGITLRQLDEAIESGSPEWHLEDKIAEDLVATIMSFTSALERLNATANKLAGEDEETIRDLLLFILNSNYQGAATGETFAGQGKTDILLRWHDRDAFIGECKFWNGSQKFTSAISQLLDRYTIWRNTQVALILFIRNVSGISDIIEKANACVENSGRLIQSLTSDEPDRRRDYLVKAANDEQRVIRLSLIPVVIPRTNP